MGPATSSRQPAAVIGVLVLDDGRLVQQGRHHWSCSLEPGTYRRLWSGSKGRRRQLQWP